MQYGTARAITNIAIVVDDSSVVITIGANGAGKSTILKTISGLVPLFSGNIEFNGRKINGLAIDKIVQMCIAQFQRDVVFFPT